MGYLADKQKMRGDSDPSYEKLPIIEMKELENTPFRFERVCIRDLCTKWGVQHKAICNVSTSTGERFSVFLSGTAVLSALEEGLADGHDWTKDDTLYVIEKVQKKEDAGSYWNIREA